MVVSWDSTMGVILAVCLVVLLVAEMVERKDVM